ncbi:MAG: inorganic phosphate transporter [Candidatus Omnitrophica bacterium]|nr:inorganic phosphate transporter [Candidatus Omnitrophota bacterium]
MHLLLIAVTIFMGMAVGWSIGANDAANSLGTAVGSKVLKLWQAIILICIFGFLGAFLQGSHVSNTIGKGIIPIDKLGKQVAAYVALVACFGACAWVILATYWKMPISTSHSIVGAVAGAGLAIGTPVKWKVLGDIFACWIFTPVGAAILGYIFYRIFKVVLYRVIPAKYVRKILTFLIVVSGCYVAYTWGANDVANATGVMVGAGILAPHVSVALGGMAIIIGIVTWGYRVIETVGTELTNLLPLMAFSAQLASAVNVHIYTVFGIPVSTSHSIVGAILGVGLVRGVKVLNLQIMREIVVCWIATPFVSGLVSFAALKVLLLIIHLG